MIYPSPKIKPAVTLQGILNIFEQNLVQGLVIDTGWMKGGVWPFFAAHRGLAELWERYLAETVRPDGGQGFSRFNLWSEGTSVTISGDRAGALQAMEQAIKLQPNNRKYRQIYERIRKKN